MWLCALFRFVILCYTRQNKRHMRIRDICIKAKLNKAHNWFCLAKSKSICFLYFIKIKCLWFHFAFICIWFLVNKSICALFRDVLFLYAYQRHLYKSKTDMILLYIRIKRLGLFDFYKSKMAPLSFLLRLIGLVLEKSLMTL